jgi:hypothetical protein
VTRTHTLALALCATLTPTHASSPRTLTLNTHTHQGNAKKGKVKTGKVTHQIQLPPLPQQLARLKIRDLDGKNLILPQKKFPFRRILDSHAALAFRQAYVLGWIERGELDSLERFGRESVEGKQDKAAYQDKELTELTKALELSDDASEDNQSEHTDKTEQAAEDPVGSGDQHQAAEEGSDKQQGEKKKTRRGGKKKRR